MERNNNKEMKNQRHVRIMRHALGLDQSTVPYRNRYICGPHSDSYSDCEELVRSGLMEKRYQIGLANDDYCYFVTPKGFEFLEVEENS